MIEEDQSEAIIAEELTKLSVQERDEVYHDLHGVSGVVHEDPEFVENCLRDLDAVLANNKNGRTTTIRPNGDSQAFEQALHSSSTSPARDRSFRLMFLRSVKFDVRRAASLIWNHFEKKAILFGRESLERAIRLDDLDVETLDCIKSGYIQLLPQRDRAGRTVLMAVARLRSFMSQKSFARALWYMGMAALEDEETQKRGVVMISYAIGESVQNRGGASYFASIVSALPMRTVGLHVCTDNPAVQALAQTLTLLLESSLRLRFRAHCGTDLECQYGLMTFGIPTKSMPVSVSGEVRTTAHLNWIEKQRRKETPSSSCPTNNNKVSDLITMPGPFDVLFGRGKFVSEHSGNQIFRQMIEDFRGQYDSALKIEKTRIAKEIVKKFQDNGGRFLKQEDDSWVAVSVGEARNKVAHSFRNRRASTTSVRADNTGSGAIVQMTTSGSLSSFSNNSCGSGPCSNSNRSGNKNFSFIDQQNKPFFGLM